MEEQKAIDKVAIPENPFISEQEVSSRGDWKIIPEEVGFGWESEEEEREFLLENYGPEFVEENWKPWDERRAEQETK